MQPVEPWFFNDAGATSLDDRVGAGSSACPGSDAHKPSATAPGVHAAVAWVVSIRRGRASASVKVAPSSAVAPTTGEVRWSTFSSGARKTRIPSSARSKLAPTIPAIRRRLHVTPRRLSSSGAACHRPMTVFVGTALDRSVSKVAPGSWVACGRGFIACRGSGPDSVGAVRGILLEPSSAVSVLFRVCRSLPAHRGSSSATSRTRPAVRSTSVAAAMFR